MKTADEILSKYWIDEYNKAGVRTGGHIIFQKDAVEAMEEYANARLQELSLTDEEIEEYATLHSNKYDVSETQRSIAYVACKRACKWARNKLTGK